jgi:hypothetical protein
VIAEAPFVFSIGALNLSLAGLAGLVATLRRGRGGELEAIDRYRLREIVEFSFANALFALAIVPLTATLDELAVAIRALGAFALVYHAASIVVLLRRQRARDVPFGGWAAVPIVVLDLAIFIAAAACIASGAIAAYEWLLVALLARPMLAFVFVLESFERPS